MNPKEEFEKGYHHLAQMFQEELRNNFHETNGSVFLNGLKRMLSEYPVDPAAIRFFQVNFLPVIFRNWSWRNALNLASRLKPYIQDINHGLPGPSNGFPLPGQDTQGRKTGGQDIVLSFVTEVSKFMQAGYVMSWHQS